MLVAGVVIVPALAGAGAGVLLDDDDRTPAATSANADGGDAVAAASLPSGEARVGKVGIYSSRGLFETYDVGDAGSLVAVQRQEGLTTNWDAITRLDDDVLLFYRARDAYAVAVQWPDDGAVLDLYSPPNFGFGWTRLTRVGPGWLHLHDSTTGNETLISYDDEVNLLTTEVLPPSRPGWTHLVRLADASLLRYDAASGAAVITTFEASGGPARDTPVSGLEPGLDGLAVTEDGRVLVRSGDLLQLLDIEGSRRPRRR